VDREVRARLGRAASVILRALPRGPTTPIRVCATIPARRATRRTLEVPRAWLKGRIQLDLGAVREFATVTLNGKTLPTQWKPPYAVDVTDVLKPAATCSASGW
jgi:hypothetical protein